MRRWHSYSMAVFMGVTLFSTPGRADDVAVRRVVAALRSAEGEAKTAPTKEQLRASRLTLEKALKPSAKDKPVPVRQGLSAAERTVEQLLKSDFTNAPKLRPRLETAREAIRWADYLDQPFRLPAALADGRSVGELTLGVTRWEDVRRAFPAAADGATATLRKTRLPMVVGGRELHARYVSTPPNSLYELYFDPRKTLVMIVDGRAYSKEGKADMLGRVIGLKETRRDSTWYEMQADLGKGVWTVAVFRAGEDVLDSIGHALAAPIPR